MNMNTPTDWDRVSPGACYSILETARQQVPPQMHDRFLRLVYHNIKHIRGRITGADAEHAVRYAIEDLTKGDSK
jgi:hypothetical protein